jgi:hypothetical protein
MRAVLRGQNVKPSDFLLGVLDVFAVLLPGSLATWLAAQYVPAEEIRHALRFGTVNASGPDLLLLVSAFVLSSFMLGHFVFMVGSRLDGLYDRWRRQTKTASRDNTFVAAEALHKEITGKNATGSFSTLKWAKAYIQVRAPHARSEIDRLEADSKFFRSIVVVSFAIAVHFLLLQQSPAAGTGALILAGLSFQRFCEQRWKMTELTYATAVIVHLTQLHGGVTLSVDQQKAATTDVGWF